VPACSRHLPRRCDRSKVANWTCGWCQLNPGVHLVGFADDDPFDGEADAFVAAVNQTVLVSFQGSHNAPNWLYDFDFLKVPYPPILGSFVHAGFYNAFEYLKPQVRALVDRALSTVCKSCTTITVVGHSFGGALGIFQALDFARYAPPALQNRSYAVDLFTYGQPRVGDATFADAVSNGGLLRTFYRSTHLEDPVPHLPLLLNGFAHAAVEIYNDELNGTHFKNCRGGEDPE
jgi:predicted lipase